LKELNACKKIQRIARGYMSRKYINCKKMKDTRAEIIRRRLIDQVLDLTHQEKIKYITE
jgi:hypothetical protein